MTRTFPGGPPYLQKHAHTRQNTPDVIFYFVTPMFLAEDCSAATASCWISTLSPSGSKKSQVNLKKRYWSWVFQTDSISAAKEALPPADGNANTCLISSN